MHQSGGSAAPCAAIRDRSTVLGGSAPAFLFFFTPLSPAAAAAFRRATALKAALSAAISHRFSFSLASKRKRNGGARIGLKKANLQNFAIEQNPPAGKGKMAKARARPKRSIPSKTARQARFFLCSQIDAAQKPLTIQFTILCANLQRFDEKIWKRERKNTSFLKSEKRKKVCDIIEHSFGRKRNKLYV